MLTSRNDDLRWILATIVESGNHRFWGWLRASIFLAYASIFLAYASIFLAYVEPNLFFAFGRKNSPVQPLTPIADPTAPSYVDSSMRGKIHLRWRSSQPQRTRLYVLRLRKNLRKNKSTSSWTGTRDHFSFILIS